VTIVRIGCAQLAPRVGDLEWNRYYAKTGIRNLAVGRESQIVVLPELMSSGYVFDSVEEAWACSEPADGPTVSQWAEDSADYGSVIVGGFAELGENGALYNSAAVVGPDGLVAVYRKTHLWDREKLWFNAGSEAPPVVETPFGRIGLAVCYDLYFPELTRGLALAGADVIVVPANLPRSPRPKGERPVEIALAQATAYVNKVWVAVCDRSNHERERGVEWTGASCIVDPDGWLAAGPIEGYGTGILDANCDYGRARNKAWGERNDVRGDLRPELYPAARPASDPSSMASSSERGESRSPTSTAP
jgi:predicted amidohydrolase